MNGRDVAIEMRDYFFPSHTLRNLRELPHSGMPTLAPLPEQRLVVVDANFIVRAATQAMKFRNPRATTVLEEIAASGTWTMIAPLIVRREVRGALLKRRIDRARFEPALNRIFGCISFVRVPREKRRRDGKYAVLAARDPKDLPYAWLLDFACADFIVSADEDLAASGFPVLRVGKSSVDVPAKVRDHGRLLADAHGRMVVATGGTQLIMAGFRATYRALGPTGAIAMLGGAFVVWKLLDAETKSRVIGGVERLRPLMIKVGEFLRPLYEHNFAATHAAKLIAAELPQRRELRLGDRVFRLALMGAYSPAEIARRLNKQEGGTLLPEAIVRVARSDPRLRLGATVATSKLVSSFGSPPATEEDDGPDYRVPMATSAAAAAR